MAPYCTPAQVQRARSRGLALVLLLLGLWGCAPEAEPPRRRALLIGIDGASPDQVQELLRAGEMPVLAGLARDGSSGLLDAPLPLISPRIWTSMVTGKQPEKHGVRGWVYHDADGQYRLYTSADRKAHALWNILSDAGLSVGVVNWLNTHPPEIARMFVAGDELARAGEVGTPERGTLFAYPPDWALRFAVHGRADRPLTAIANPFRGPPGEAEALYPWLAEFFDQDEWATRGALEIQAALEPDLLLVYLPGVDRVSHFLWSCRGPQAEIPEALRSPPAELGRCVAALHDYYRFADALIGLLVAPYGAQDLVMVVSDHGFENPTGGQMPGVHDSEAASHGIVYVRGPGIPAGGALAEMSVNDVAPTLLGWFGLAPADDMDGRPLDLEPFRVDRSVATYDTTPIERLSGSDSAFEKPILEKLRALGYVD